MVEEPGCKKRPKPLPRKHSNQSDKAEKWRRRRGQFHQAKDNTDDKASTECEQECLTEGTSGGRRAVEVARRGAK
jgi:hypothetical protein